MSKQQLSAEIVETSSSETETSKTVKQKQLRASRRTKTNTPKKPPMKGNGSPSATTKAELIMENDGRILTICVFRVEFKLSPRFEYCKCVLMSC